MNERDTRKMLRDGISGEFRMRDLSEFTVTHKAAATQVDEPSIEGVVTCLAGLRAKYLASGRLPTDEELAAIGVVRFSGYEKFDGVPMPEFVLGGKLLS